VALSFEPDVGLLRDRRNRSDQPKSCRNGVRRLVYTLPARKDLLRYCRRHGISGLDLNLLSHDASLDDG